MNEPQPPVDDEIVSAVLDGEATAEERALVEASPEAMARLDQLRRAAERVAEPVVPLSEATADDLLHAVLPPSVDTTPRPGDQLAARRERRARGARVLGAAAAVAAAALLVVGLASVIGRSSSDESASSGASADTSSAAGEGLDDTAGLAALPDLGAASGTDVLLDRLGTLVEQPADFEHEFEESGRTASDGAVAPEVASSSSFASCPAPTTSPDASWVLVATGTLPSGSVVLFTDGPPAPGSRVVVVDAATCAVVGEGTI